MKLAIYSKGRYISPKLTVYSKAHYTSAIDALKSGSICHIRELNDIDDTATLQQLNGNDMRNAELWSHIQTTENALEATGNRNDYVFILMDDKLPRFELVDDKWVEISEPNPIVEDLEKIEKWKGIAYCGPNTQGAGPEGDEIYQALHSIRKTIGIGVESYDIEVARATDISNLNVVDGELFFDGINTNLESGCVTGYNEGNEFAFWDHNKNATIVSRDFDSSDEAENAMIDYYIKHYIDPKYK